MPIITMQPLKLEDLTAQFDSIVRRYRDGGFIAYRDAGELLKYEGGLPEVNRLKISWLTRFKNRPAMRDELEKNLVSSVVRNFRTTAAQPSVKFP